MKKIMHGLFGDSSDEKKHHEHHEVHHLHGHPEDLTGIQLNNQPIQTEGGIHKGGELHGVPLTYGPMNLHTHSLLPPSSLRSPSQKSPVHFESEVHQHTPWLQLHTLDNAVELMVEHLKVLDHDVDMAFKSLGLKRQRERQHDGDIESPSHHHEHDRLAEKTTRLEEQHEAHQEFPMDWTNESSRYRIKIPMGYNVNPEHINVTMEDRILIVKYKNAMDTQTGHMEEQLIKKIPMPEAVDAKKLRVMFKPEGYLLIEGPELQGSHQQHFASAAGENVKRDYADAVSQGAKKLRDEQPTVTPRLNETQRQTKSFEQETTYATRVSPPRVSETGSQLGHVMEPRGPYIQETSRPGHLDNQHIVHQSQHMTQQTQPMVQHVQTVHGRFEGPLDTSAFASIQPAGRIPGYMPEHGYERSGYDQMRHDVNRGVDQVHHKAEDIKHQAGHKWEETKDKAADLKDKAGDKLEDAKEGIKEGWENTKEKAAELTDKAGDKLHDAKEGIKEGWEHTKEKVSDLADKAGDKLEAAKDKVVEGWEKTKDKVSELAEKTGDKLEAAKDTIVDKTKAAKDKVADALTPDEKPEHHEIRRQEFHRPIQQQQPIQQQHVRIEQDYEYTKPVGQNQPLHGRVETHVQQRQEQPPLNRGLHQQQVQQSVQHGHIGQPQIHRQQQPQQHHRIEQHHEVIEKNRSGGQQPMRQQGNVERQGFPQQPAGRRRSDETHTESRRPQQHEQHHVSKTERTQERTPVAIPRSEQTHQGQDVQVPLVDTAVGRRMSQEDAKKPPSSTVGVEQRDWVNKPELRAEHINKVGYEDIMKQSVARSESGTGKTQVHFTPPAEGGRRDRSEGVQQTQQIHRDVNRRQPEVHERRTEHTKIQQQQPQRHDVHKEVQRHEVHKDVHEQHEDQPNKLERGLEKVADKVLGFFGVEVEGHHKEDVKDQVKHKGEELKHKAGEKVDQAKDKTEELKHRAGQKVDQAKDKTEELKNRAGQKVDQAKNKAEDVKNKAGQKAHETKEQAGEAWERTKAKTAEMKDQAGQKINDVKHTTGAKIDQAKSKASDLKDRAGDKMEHAKEKTAETWQDTKNKAADLKDKAGDKLEGAKEGIKEGWENTKEKVSDLADKAGDKLVAAKDTVVDTAKAAKDKVADALTPSQRASEHHIQRTHHQEQPLGRTQLHQQPIQRSELLQQPLHGQRTRIEQDYEYSRPVGSNQPVIPNPQMQPMAAEFQHRQPFPQQPGVTTHFEKHVEKHREVPAPTGGKIEEHFEHHEVLPGQQQRLHQRTGIQQQNIQRPGESVGHKVDQAKESVSDTLEEGKQRGQRMVNKAGEKLHEAKESVGQTLEDTKHKAAELTDKAGNKLHDAKEAVVEKWEDTKDKAAELTDKAGNKLHDAKESVKETLHDTKEKAAELTDKAGHKLHDAKESVKETLHDTKEKIADTWEGTKDKAAELKDKAGEKLEAAKDTLVEAKDTVAEKLGDAKDTVAEKLSHAKDKVVDFFTPDQHEEVHHRQEEHQRSGVRPASHLSSQTVIDERHREDLLGKPVKVRLEGPVTIQGRVVGGEVLASDLTLNQGQVTNVNRGAVRGQAVSGTHGFHSENVKQEVKNVPQQQQQTKIESKTTKVVHEERRTVAPGGLLKKGTTTHQSPQAM